jgi:three-Cys-motif partner protein
VSKPREWGFWTERKLQILQEYLGGFTNATKQFHEKVYIDLMSGDPENRAKYSLATFNGSVRVALDIQPPFTRLAFFEKDSAKASRIKAEIGKMDPMGSRALVYEGDCNENIDQIYIDFKDYRNKPTFVFLDQQGAEISWSTIVKLSQFRFGSTKSELWILMNPASIARGIKGSKNEDFRESVDLLYGSHEWRDIYREQESGTLDPTQVHDEMINLFRWQLERTLGYRFTLSFPLHNEKGFPLYEMVFATDNGVGMKIMYSSYKKADRIAPGYRKKAIADQFGFRDRSGTPALFPVEPSMVADPKKSKSEWANVSPSDPKGSVWWQRGTG